MHRPPPRRLKLRPDTLRVLTDQQLTAARGGRIATGAADSCEPCPGDYTWFCKP